MINMERANKLSVAILGTTGYIGRSLLHEFGQDPDVEVVGYSRDKETARKTLDDYKVDFHQVKDYSELANHEYDVLINATGIGSPKKLSAAPTAVFGVTEDMDRVAFQYLDNYPRTRVFNFSSAAVYGQAAANYVTPDSQAAFAVNSLSVKDGYAFSKLHSEARHRSRNNNAIVDLRVFAFVSRFLDPQDSFLVSEIAKCLKENQVLKTKPDDMIRDFTTAKDIAAVILFFMKREPTNDVFDLKSGGAVAKFELLNKLKEELKLSYEVEDIKEMSPTGSKTIYAPSESRLEALGYRPLHTSLENVVTELRLFLAL